MPDRTLKRQKLRNNEYYIMQDTLDDLYEKSMWLTARNGRYTYK